MTNRLKASPRSVLIEQTAMEMAQAWYEIGRSQGMTSIHPDHKSFARANWKKFIPKAVDSLTELLGKDTTPADMKEQIYEALMERVNDPELCMAFNNSLPDIDVKKLLDNTLPAPIVLNTRKKTILEH